MKAEKNCENCFVQAKQKFKEKKAAEKAAKKAAAEEAAAEKADMEPVFLPNCHQNKIHLWNRSYLNWQYNLKFHTSDLSWAITVSM